MIILSFLALLFSPAVHAQPFQMEHMSTSPATVMSAAGMSETPVKGLLFGSQEIFVELHGFVSVEAYGFQRQAERPNSSFDLNTWYFATKVTPTKDFHAVAEIEYEHGTADIRLDRAFVEWDAHSWAMLRFGRFNSPVSHERSHYQAPYRLMTSRPLMVDVALHEWSDTGVEAYGYPIPGRKWLQYDFAVVNGPRGLSEAGVPVRLGQDDRDNNRNKTVVGRLNLIPLKGLGLGAAYAAGKYDDAGRLGFKILELDARYASGRLDLSWEYMKRTGDDEPAPVAANPFITGTQAGLQGWFAQAAYDVLRDRPHVYFLKPVLRYDTMKKTSDGAGTNRITVGLNYSPVRHVVLKSEYQFLRQFKQPQAKSDGAMLSLTIDF